MWQITITAINAHSVPGIQRVARKLGVDYAQAMIGWDFHGGGSHPVYVMVVGCGLVVKGVAFC